MWSSWQEVIEDWRFWVILVLLCSIGIHLLVEVIYFLRTFVCVFLAKFVKKKIHILEKCSVGGICLTRDVDTMLNHMNNARYFRELDLARIDFYLRTRLYDVVRKNQGHIILGNANIRFRKFIRLFARFKITTKVIYWNEKSIFLEHRFIGSRDGMVHAILLCQQKMVNCNGETVMDELLKKGTMMLSKPEMPLEVAKFLELQEVSRKTLNSTV